MKTQVFKFDTSITQVIRSYFGPGNPSGVPHPYVYLLFRQNFQNIVLAEDWILRIGIPFEFQMNLQEFMTAHDLEGNTELWYCQRFNKSKSKASLASLRLIV